MAAEINMYRGDSYPITFTLKDGASGDLIDLTSSSFILTVSTAENPVDDTTKLFDCIGLLDADPTTGKVSFTPTTTDTDIARKKYYYDVQQTDSVGNIRTVVKDVFNILMDVTK